MKMFSSGLLVFASLFCGSASAPMASINSRYNSVNAPTAEDPTDNPTKAMNSLKIGKVEASRPGDIAVEVLNPSKKPIKLWNDSNSWGAASWRVLLLRKGQLETFFQNPDQIFTVNRPTFNEIAAGGRLEQKLDLNGGNWCGFGHCSPYNERGFAGKKINFEANDMVIVVYDVPATQESRNLGVWYGVVTAATTVQ